MPNDIDPSGHVPDSPDSVSPETVASNAQPQRGVLGEFAASEFRGKYNMRLLRQAVKNEWPVSDAVKRIIVAEMTKTVVGAEKPRDKAAAARVLVQADSLNVRREHGPRQPDQHLHLHEHQDKPATALDLKARLAQRRRLREQQAVAESAAAPGDAVANPAHGQPVIIETSATSVPA